MRCIICLEEKDESEEHIYPFAIGSRKLTIKTVCATCNSNMGSSIDYHLTDHPVILTRRYILGIKDRNGNIPDPFKSKVVKAYLEDVSDIPVNFTTDGDKKLLKIKAIKAEILVSEDNETDEELIYHYFIADNSSEIEKMVNTVAKRKFYEPIPKVIIDEGLKQKEVDFNKLKLIIDEEKFNNFILDKAFLKIAYELAYYWLGNQYLDDQTAALIRETLKNPNKQFKIQEINGSIHKIRGSESIFLDGFVQNYHLGALYKDEKNNVWCFVRIFDVFEGRFIISKNAKNYCTPNKFISINANTGEIEEKDFE